MKNLSIATWAPVCGALLASAASAQVSIGNAVRIDTGRGAQPCNETTVSVSKSNPLEIVAGWNDYRQGSPRTGVGLSLDGGATWTDFLLRPPLAFQSGVEGDPMTAFDDRTGAIWAGGISFAGNGGIFVARKDAGASTFGPVVMALTGGGIDKGWMAAGPDPANPSGATRLYLSYNLGTQVSSTMGDTWGPVVSLGTGLGFLPRVGPNGNAYVAYWDTGNQMLLRRSTNGGVSWQAPVLVATRMDVWGIDGSRTPGNFRVASLAALAVDPVGGALYYVYPDTTNVASNGSNVDLYFSRSTDQGVTWSVPTVINTDPTTPGDQFFPFVDVDAHGRIHIVWYDTSRTVQNDSAAQGLIDVVYAYSDNGGTTWTQSFVTAAPFSSATDGFGGGFMGDYLGISTAGEHTWPVYPSTVLGNADVFTNAVQHGPATTFCFGIGCPCGNNDPDAGCGNRGVDVSNATGSLLAASGTAVTAADNLVFTLSGISSGSFGIIFAGPTATAPVPFGDGRRCVGGTVFRYPARAANAGGVITYGPGEVVSISQGFGGGGAVVPGSTWYYQGWYRDLSGPCASSFNTTNAARVVWQ